MALLFQARRIRWLSFNFRTIPFSSLTTPIGSPIEFKVVWRFFYALIGSKINFSKNTILRVVHNMAVATQIDSDLGCRVDNFPFVYSSIPLRGRTLDCNGWNLVVDIFRERFSQWKCCHLFIGGRLTLMRSDLYLILIYCLFVDVLPLRVRNQLHSLMSRFLWGEMDKRRKLHMADWQKVTKPCERGGLRISDLSSMNATLLAKWACRYANDWNHLWRRIVCVKSDLDPNKMLLVMN